MFSFLKFICEAAKSTKDNKSAKVDKLKHLWHLNEIFLFDEDGVNKAKSTLTEMLSKLKKPLDSSNLFHVSVKFDGSISVVFGYVTKEALLEALELRKKTSKGEATTLVNSRLESIKKISDGPHWVVGYKGALENPEKLVLEESNLSDLSHPDNVKDILKILLNNSSIMKESSSSNVLLIQADVLMHNAKDKANVLNKQNEDYYATPNLITYQIKHLKSKSYQLGLVPHTYYSSSTLASAKAHNLTEEMIYDRFNTLGKETLDLSQLLDIKDKSIETKETISILGNNKVYVLNYDFTK